ncbi:tRNA pseudouridine(65) synthase TruC [Candidatus Endoriftia persephonae]|jgi:tRNA pseudouridine65 synthase|uniref:tRNA pseudouridine synthase C n=2 Tax=Gammaproteobacteria TaxID=1236 RepID=G2FH85_9GAMM|nr:tRNA pseudouridine(65) synthase TruC [Candidatus Endoriftia persephone]EGW53899.1 tRNA pseudouridine synthase C [endosymbiont of Tevnia jerichonana (vent Tica)]USF87747.1 tRNA pseudouridine(65) synthase TruC [Candidatus Endoriftia persephone]
MGPLEIIYQDQAIVAINKPAGLLVHPSLVDRYETRSAMKLLRDQLGRWVYPVHRLDKPTSGVLLFALNSEVAQRLGEQFEGRGVEKRYLAVVRGHPDQQEVIDYPLKELLDKMTDRRARQNKPAQPAVTRYRCLATAELPYRVDRYPSSRYALLELCPETGRKHQIRRHMKHIFHPIIGDTSYGKSRHNRLFERLFDCRRLLLTAVTLCFRHPLSDVPMRLTSELDPPFTRVVHGMTWSEVLAERLMAADGDK